MFTFHQSGVYTTRNAQMSFQKEVWNHLKLMILLKQYIMKNIMISLMMVIAATTTSFANSNNTDVANTVKSVAEQVKQAPSGTVYGVITLISMLFRKKSLSLSPENN